MEWVLKKKTQWTRYIEWNAVNNVQDAYNLICKTGCIENSALNGTDANA